MELLNNIEKLLEWKSNQRKNVIHHYNETKNQEKRPIMHERKEKERKSSESPAKRQRAKTIFGIKIEKIS